MRPSLPLFQVCLLAAALFFSTAAAAQEGDAPDLRYTIDSFPDIIRKTGTDQEAALPNRRIYYDASQKIGHSIKANIGDRVVECKPSYQDVAYVRKDDESITLPVIAFKGCPFTMIEAFESVKRDRKIPVAFRKPVDLKIEHVEGNVAFLAADSELPFIIVRGQVIPGVGAAGTTWTFLEKGTRMEGKNGHYVTSKDGATIRFHEYAVDVSGIEKAK